MSKIQAVFARLQAESRTALIPYIAAGDPAPGETVPLMHALVAAGADVIELGVPFSDPMADGPTIQRAAERALKFGVSLRDVLAMVREFRTRDVKTPVVLMGYANPIEAMGAEAFIAAAVEAGADGVLVVDYPPEEAADFAQQARAAGLDMIFLLAPTSTPERVARVAELGSGYAYYVSLKGVTGSANLNVGEVLDRVSGLKAALGIPVGVGFGIRDAQTASAIGAVADAVVIGSRVIEEIERAPAGEACARVGEFLVGIRQALDESPVEAKR